MLPSSDWTPNPGRDQFGQKYCALPFMHYDIAGPSRAVHWKNDNRNTPGFIFYSSIVSGEHGAELTSYMRGHQAIYTRTGGWFPENRISSAPGKQRRYFGEAAADRLVQCERCGTLYNAWMRAVAPNDLLRSMGPYPSISYVFCPANNGDFCRSNPTIGFIFRLDMVAELCRQVTLKTIDILSCMPRNPFVNCVYGAGIPPKATGIQEVELANKALRVVWIRHFACRQLDHSGNDSDSDTSFSSAASVTETQMSEFCAEDPMTGPAAIWLKTNFGDIALWGDARVDLTLFYEGVITAKQLKYVYGIDAHGLEYLLSRNMDEELTWVNAYVGCRRHVTSEHYMVLKRAIQRVGSAMEKFVALSNQTMFQLVGLRFHELHSALAANYSAMDLRVNEVVQKRPSVPL